MRNEIEEINLKERSRSSTRQVDTDHRVVYILQTGGVVLLCQNNDYLITLALDPGNECEK